MKQGLVMDEINQDLLKRIAENPGLSMIEIGEPYLQRMSEAAVRLRIRELRNKGFIKLEKTRHNITRCYPAEA